MKMRTTKRMTEERKGKKRRRGRRGSGWVLKVKEGPRLLIGRSETEVRILVLVMEECREYSVV